MSQKQSSSASSGNTQGQKPFFDLHTRGIGYLNRVRLVNTKGKGGRRGEPFLACSVNALHGDAEAPNNTMFDCRVSGSDAQLIVNAVKPDLEANKKVLIAFCVGDIYAHPYERKVKKPDQSGKYVETGEIEAAALIKGRLLQITYVKVDDDVVYQIKDGVVDTSLDIGTSDEGTRRTGTEG